jgi:hypothetical protein
MLDATADIDLAGEIKVIRDIIERGQVASRRATYDWIIALYSLTLCIANCKKLKANLLAEYDRHFPRHPRTSLAWRLIKLCILDTETPTQTAHRWSQAIEFAQSQNWSEDEFAKLLAKNGIDGVLRMARTVRPPRREPVSIPVGGAESFLAELETHQAERLSARLEESEPYVLIVVRMGDRIRITHCVKLAASLSVAIERQQRRENGPGKRVRDPPRRAA